MNFYLFTKRALDIAGGLVGVILFAPLMLATVIWIKLVSPGGPVFLEAIERVGKDGKEFPMYKFRSMIPHAQEWLKNHPELYQKYQENGYKLDPDPRWIKGAEFMRKYSIDEMPQFFNVLFGSMSLVGYRAYYGFELEEQVIRFPDAKQYLDIALTVKPGITGVWQTEGRSSVGFLDRVKIDATYAKRKSVLYDLLIILKTPFAVLSGKGAF